MENNVASGNPYVGPRPFQREERDRFFGREREGRDLLSLVISERLTLFYAQSGAGKTSLINTRLIPGLEARGFEVLPVGRVSGDLPPGVQADNIFALNLMLKVDTGEDDPARFQGMRLAQFLGELTSAGVHTAAALPMEGASPVETGVPLATDVSLDVGVPADLNIPPRALIIDQFEELFNTHPEAWHKREDFFRQLVEAMDDDPYLWVVLAMREDYIGGLDPYVKMLPGGLRARYSMQRLGESAALDAVMLPTARQRPFEHDAAQNLVSNLSSISAGRDANGVVQFVPGEYVEPVQLQVVCYQLWEALKDQPGERITQGDIDRLARGRSLAEFVNRALADFYSDVVRRVASAPGVNVGERRLREWFATQMITEARTRGFVFMGGQATGGIPNTAVRLLEGQLLRGENRAGGRWYELVHDRFIEPILQSNREWALERSRAPRLASLVGVGLLALVAVGLAIWAGTATQAVESISDQSQMARATAVVAQERSTQAAVTALAAQARSTQAEAVAQAAWTAEAERRYGLAQATSTIQALGVASTAQAMEAQLLALQVEAPLSATPLVYPATPTRSAPASSPPYPGATPSGGPTATLDASPPVTGDGPTLTATMAVVASPETPAPSATATPTAAGPDFTRPAGTPYIVVQAATAQALKVQLSGLYATQTVIAAPVKRTIIGQTSWTTPIWATQLGNGPVSILLVGGLHSGFAPSTTKLAEQLELYFQEHLDEIPASLSLHIIANANPDATIAPGMTEGRLNAHDVDLNRNWDCDWSRVAIFRNRSISGGTAAFSEPETQALRDYIQSIQPAAVVVWTARAANGLVSPGGCGERSLFSNVLANIYGDAARYVVEPFVAYAVNGDMTNWLDSQGIPAIFVTIKDYERPDVDSNLKAIQKLLEAYAQR